jgi:hypothetical protein
MMRDFKKCQEVRGAQRGKGSQGDMGGGAKRCVWA